MTYAVISTLLGSALVRRFFCKVAFPSALPLGQRHRPVFPGCPHCLWFLAGPRRSGHLGGFSWPDPARLPGLAGSELRFR